MNSFFRILKTSGAVFTLSVFLLTNTVPSGFALPEVRSSKPASANLLPSKAVKIERAVYKDNVPLVLYIQDAHANPEAQESIRQTLHELYEKVGGAQFAVALEGTTGSLHPEYLHFFSDYPYADKAIVDDLTAKGELTGAELFARDLDLRGQFRSEMFRGVEDVRVYRKNAEAYQRLIREGDLLRDLLGVFKAAFKKAESRWYNPELRDFVQEKARKKEGDFGGARGIGESRQWSSQWDVYLNYLKEKAAGVLRLDLDQPAEQIRFPNLTRIFTLTRLQGEMNYENARRQWQSAAPLLDEASQERIAGLLDGKRHGQEPLSRDFFIRLLTEKPEAFRALEAQPDLRRFFAVQVLSSEIDVQGLTDEMTRLERAIAQTLSKTTEERRLFSLSEDFMILQKMLLLELTAEDWEKAGSNLSAFEPEAIAGGLKRLGIVVPPYDAVRLKMVWQDAVDFYVTAHQRDQIIVSKAMEFAAANKPNVMVLIAGGFHTNGVERLLKHESVSYAIARPVMKNSDGGRLYHKAMAGENSILEDMPAQTRFASEQAGLFLKGILETGVPAIARREKSSAEDLMSAVEKVLKIHPVLSRDMRLLDTGSAIEVAMPVFETPAAITAAVKQLLTTEARSVYDSLSPGYVGELAIPADSRWTVVPASTPRGVRLRLQRSEVRTYSDANVQGTLLGAVHSFPAFDASQDAFIAQLAQSLNTLLQGAALPADLNFALFSGERAITPNITLTRPDRRNNRHLVRVNLDDLRIIQQIHQDSRLANPLKQRLLDIVALGFANGAYHVNAQQTQDAPGLEARLYSKADGEPFRQLGLLLYTLKFAGVQDFVPAVSAYLSEAQPHFISFFLGLTGFTSEDYLRAAETAKTQLPNTSEFRKQLITDLATHVLYRTVVDQGVDTLAHPDYRRAMALLNDIYGDEEKAFRIARDGIRANYYIDQGIQKLSIASTGDDLVKAMNTVLTYADQIAPWKKGTSDAAGDSVYLPLKPDENTVLEASFIDVQSRLAAIGITDLAAYGISAAPDGQGTRVSNAGLEKIGKKLALQTYAVVNAGGLGSRFGQRDYTHGDEPEFVDQAKGVYTLNLGAQGDRSFYEIAVAEMTAVNHDLRQEGVITAKRENMPLVFLASQFTFNDTVKDLQRIGFTQYESSNLQNPAVQGLLGVDRSIAQVSPNVSVFHHENQDAPLVYLIHLQSTELINKRTGEFYRHTDSGLGEKDLTWPDNHDGSILDPIATGLTAHLAKQGRRFRFVSNIDNRAGDVDVRLTAILYMSGQSLLNEGAEIRGEKGGLLTKFLGLGGLPAWLIQLAQTFKIKLWSKRLVEGFELAPPDKAEEKRILDKLALFNTANYVADDRKIEPEIFGDQRFPGFLSGILASLGSAYNWLVSELAYRFINFRVEAHKTVKSKDGVSGAVYPTALAGSVPGSPAATVYVEVSRDEDSRFEPQKESLGNLLDIRDFLQYLSENLPQTAINLPLSDVSNMMAGMIQADELPNVDPQGKWDDGTSLAARMKFILSDKAYQKLTAAEGLERVNKAIQTTEESIARVAKKNMLFFSAPATSNGSTPVSFGPDTSSPDLGTPPDTAKSEVRAAVSEPFVDTSAFLEQISAESEIVSVETSVRTVAGFLGGIYTDAAAARAEVRIAIQNASLSSEFTPEERNALGQDFIERFFSAGNTVLYRQNQSLVLRENISDAPELNQGLKLWLKYLATHRDVTWEVDIDSLVPSEAESFQDGIYKFAEGLGIHVGADQIRVLASQRPSFEPEMLSKPKTAETHGFLALAEDYLMRVPGGDQVNFRRSAKVTALDRMIAAEALRDQIPDELRNAVGPLSELAIARGFNYEVFTQRFQAYESIAASA